MNNNYNIDKKPLVIMELANNHMGDVKHTKNIVNGFNKIGASSKDLIDVLKAVKTAGALHAELVIR